MKRPWRSVFRVAFFMSVATDAIAALTGSVRIRRVVKPMIMPTLAAAASPADLGLATGLTMAWIGDVALLGSDPRHFRAGIGAFALTHAGYAGSFIRRGSRPPVTTAVTITAASATGAWVFGRAAGDLAPIVRAYALAIGAMAICAAGVHGPGRRRTVSGAGLFMVSDALIGLRRFVLPPGMWSRTADLAVMITYGAAQWLIHSAPRRNAQLDPERGRADLGQGRR
jgi:uncharacterized membrane protein YhhN